MKKFTRVIALLISVTMINFSCQDQELSNDHTIMATHKQQISDSMKREIALLVADAINDQDVRAFIKSEAMARFDGDYEFLLLPALDKQINTDPSGRSRNFGDVLLGIRASNSSRAAFTDSILSINPLIQISIPSLPTAQPEDWNVLDQKPLVAFIPSVIENDIIPAYDSDGNLVNLSSKNPPNKTVIVISENERLISFPKDKGNGQARSACLMQPRYSTFDDEYFLITDLNDCGSIYNGGGSGGGGSNNTTSCTRDSRQNKDVLNKMIFKNMEEFRRVNDWFDGGQELQITIFFGTANGTITKLTKYATGNDRDFKKCGLFNCDPEWFNINLEIVTWDKDVYGSAMLYSWLERDPGDPTTFSTSFASTFDNNGVKNTVTNQVSTTITNKDDLLGEAVVEYCDNANGDGYLYNTGKISFYVKEK